VSRFALLDIGQTLFVFTLYKILLSGKTDLKAIGRDMVTSPILWAVFLGILTGAYQIVATNWLFPAQFEKTYDEMLMAISQIGISGAELDEMVKMYRSMIFSPLPSMLTDIFSGVLTAGFYGLFIAIGVKREPDLFDTEEDDEE
jgi:hypothetical protein